MRASLESDFFDDKGREPCMSSNCKGIVPPANRRVDDDVIVTATTVANRAEAEKHAAEAGKSEQRGLLARELRPFAEE
jgi:hypothetical protein